MGLKNYEIVKGNVGGFVGCFVWGNDRVVVVNKD